MKHTQLSPRKLELLNQRLLLSHTVDYALRALLYRYTLSHFPWQTCMALLIWLALSAFKCRIIWKISSAFSASCMLNPGAIGHGMYNATNIACML